MRPSASGPFTGLPAIAGTADEGRVSWGRHANAATRCRDAARPGSSDGGAARLLRSACSSCSHSGQAVRVPPNRHLRSLKTPSSWGRSMSPLCRAASRGSKGRRPYSPHPFRHRHPPVGRHAFVRRHPLLPRHPFRQRTADKAAPRRHSTRNRRRKRELSRPYRPPDAGDGRGHRQQVIRIAGLRTTTEHRTGRRRRDGRRFARRAGDLLHARL